MPEPLRIRMALHTGEADLRDGDYYGSTVNRCARLRGLAHGGQILLSASTTHLARQGSSQLTMRALGSHPLRGLGEPELIYQLDHPDLPSDFPPLASSAKLDNLPLELPTLFGRADDVDELTRLLETRRLVTLTGTGGAGKTRLALEVAGRMRGDFVDGVWLVELSPVTDPRLVPQAIAMALGVREAGRESLTDTLPRVLADKDLLLVVDNCEHVIEAAADLVSTLIQKCPHLRVLATSREALDVVGERIWPVPMLALLQLDDNAAELVAPSASLDLLVERVRAVRPDFGLTPDNVAAAIEICRRLDGIPLAIELAARRVTTLSLEQIAARLRDSFAVLSRANRSAPARHQTLSTTIEWSYDLLEPNARRLFERLSVFAGEFALDAVERASAWGGIESGELLDLLQRLVATSHVEMTVVEGTALYRLLATLRQFAAERLDQHGEASRTREAHAAFYLALASDTPRPWAFSGYRFDRMERMEREHDDLRGALDWLTAAGRVSEALILATSLSWAWSVRGYGGEMLRRITDLLESTRSMATAERAAALRAAGRLAWGARRRR
jgi:predicted ATPase